MAVFSHNPKQIAISLSSRLLRSAAARKLGAAGIQWGAMKHPKFRLYWLRETSTDIGTPVRPEDLPPSISARVVELAAGDPGEFAVRLPYLDRREMRRRDTVLASVAYERTGHLIRGILPPAEATRDMLATLALGDPLWRSAPHERDPRYFYIWQRVAQALQHWLRDRVPLEYFHNLDVTADRKRCNPMMVYQACRIYPGRPRTDFAYDLGNYPWSHDTLAFSWRMTGSGIQRVLSGLQRRLKEDGRFSIACRYTPAVYNDVLLAVQRRPRAYANLLIRESSIINAVIDLGTRRDPETIRRSARIINRALRNMHFQDLRRLAPDLLEEARRVLALRPFDSGENRGEIRILEHTNVSPPRRPRFAIGGQKNRHDRYSHGRRQMRDPGIIPDIDSRAGEPACQLV